MTLIRNEQTKLLATYLNGLGIAVFAVGSLAPVFSSLYGDRGPSGFMALVSILCVFVSGTLHLMARRVLRRLEP